MEPKFRFANKRVMLTYKTHLDKVKYTEWITEKGKAMKFIRLAHEKGDSEMGYDHTHVLIEYASQLQTTNPRYWDYLEIHPHVDVVSTKLHWGNSLKYIAKEDHANDDVVPASSVVEGIWKSETLQDALRGASSHNEMIPIIAAYGCKPRDDFKVEPPLEWREWQQQLLTILNDRVDDRKIIWIYDPVGSGGKSRLAAYVEDWMDGILLTQLGGARDTATILANESTLNDRPIMIDLPRQAQAHAIYEPLEAIKNGRMTAIKYQGKRMRWRPGHVCVMANFLPESTAWTWDRYFVFEILRTSRGMARLTLEAGRFLRRGEEEQAP